jgi:hypothetical protein
MQDYSAQPLVSVDCFWRPLLVLNRQSSTSAFQRKRTIVRRQNLLNLELLELRDTLAHQVGM